MNEDKNNNKNKKESVGSGQACFPTEIAEVDGFIADMLERYGADVGDSLIAGDSLFRDGMADLLGAIVTFVLDYLPNECHTAGCAIALLENCTWPDDGRIGDVFNLAINELMCGYRSKCVRDPLSGEQLPYLKPSPMARNSDGMHPFDCLRFGAVRGFLPNEDEALNRYCRFIALIPDPNMRMSVRYAALALLKYSFPHDIPKRPRYSIRKIIDDLG